MKGIVMGHSKGKRGIYMKTWFVYRFIGENEEKMSPIYDGTKGFDEQSKFLKKNRNKIEYCEVKSKIEEGDE